MVHNIILHKSSERGGADHGWLKTKFSFSFANYHNPSRRGFGKLRVLNDDVVAPGHGFPTHPHENMEIITIVLKGELTHKDSTGAEETIKPGQIQVMSAGSGVVHSEMNNSTKPVELLQIWIEPEEKDVPPRHEEKTINLEPNKLTKIVSGKKDEDTAYIHQDAQFFLGEFDAEKRVSVTTSKGRGLFMFLIQGSCTFEEKTIHERDSLEVTGAESVALTTKEKTKLLVIDVPL